jgi:hypothetical protein
LVLNTMLKIAIFNRSCSGMFIFIEWISTKQTSNKANHRRSKQSEQKCNNKGNATTKENHTKSNTDFS